MPLMSDDGYPEWIRTTRPPAAASFTTPVPHNNPTRYPSPTPKEATASTSPPHPTKRQPQAPHVHATPEIPRHPNPPLTTTARHLGPHGDLGEVEQGVVLGVLVKLERKRLFRGHPARLAAKANPHRTQRDLLQPQRRGLRSAEAMRCMMAVEISPATTAAPFAPAFVPPMLPSRWRHSITTQFPPECWDLPSHCPM